MLCFKLFIFALCWIQFLKFWISRISILHKLFKWIYFNYIHIWILN